jgi:glycosyltransferase involved in cell wall biosynthesis
MDSNMKKPNVSLFIPLYKDEYTVEILTLKAINLLEKKANAYQIIFINDGSPDKSGNIANKMAKKYPHVQVFHHKKNMGYGATFKSGVKLCKYDLIGMIDGDDEYDMEDMGKMIDLQHFYHLIIAFRYKKLYSTKRIFISYIYNVLLRLLFKTRYRDISTGIRFFRKSILDQIQIKSNSPFLGAELVIKSMFSGFHIGEIGIQTFPREFHSGSAVTGKNIYLTIKDMIKTYKEIFSENYNLPKNRIRK